MEDQGISGSLHWTLETGWRLSQVTVSTDLSMLIGPGTVNCPYGDTSRETYPDSISALKSVKLILSQILQAFLDKFQGFYNNKTH